MQYDNIHDLLGNSVMGLVMTDMDLYREVQKACSALRHGERPAKIPVPLLYGADDLKWRLYARKCVQSVNALIDGDDGLTRRLIADARSVYAGKDLARPMRECIEYCMSRIRGPIERDCRDITMVVAEAIACGARLSLKTWEDTLEWLKSVDATVFSAMIEEALAWV